MKWLTSEELHLGGVRVSLASLLVAIALLIVGFLVASKITSRIRSPREFAGGARWRSTLAQAVGYATRALVVVIALHVAGVDLGAVLAASAVVAVGVGIAMQKVAENFVSGVILMAERSIREGDVIEFEGRIARVRRVGIRATIAQTLDDEEIIVPNSILTQNAVKNLTLTTPTYRVRVGVGVSYASDMERVEVALYRAAEGVPWRERANEPVVLWCDFGASSVDFEVSVWTRDAWGLRRCQSDLRRAVWRALAEDAITIPFTQVDVHLDDAVLRAMDRVAAPRSRERDESRGARPAAPGGATARPGTEPAG